VGGQAEILSVFKHIQTLLGKDSDSDEGHSSGSTSKALRLDALSLVVAVLESGNHDPACVRKALTSALLPQLCASVKEQWYKVIAEGLRALAAVPRFFVVSKDPSDKEETVAVANKLYESVEPLLAAHDVDQEIKECALMATAKLLSELAGGRSDATQQYLTKDQTDRLTSLLLERLKNETTRIPAIKTLSTVSSSNPDLGFREGILKDMIKTMAGFLKMSSRSLRQTSLEALDVVVTHHGHTIVGETSLYSSLLSELSDLVVDSDLHISHLALYVKKMFSWRNVR
jgi:cullin-associated NEDD8-dissociated protein 1